MIFFVNYTILYWLCHTSTWIHHGCTHVPHPEPPLPPPSPYHLSWSSQWTSPKHPVSCIEASFSKVAELLASIPNSLTPTFNRSYKKKFKNNYFNIIGMMARSSATLEKDNNLLQNIHFWMLVNFMT